MGKSKRSTGVVEEVQVLRPRVPLGMVIPALTDAPNAGAEAPQDPKEPASAAPSPRHSPYPVSSREIRLTLILRTKAPLPEVTGRIAPTPLTHEEFEALHGADPKDADKVVAFMERFDFKLEDKQLDRAMLVFKGTEGKAAEAFNVAFGTFCENHMEFRCADHDPVLSAEIIDIVRCVLGLNEDPVVGHDFICAGESERAYSTEEVSRALKDAAKRGPHRLPSQRYFAHELARLYDFPDLDGEGQCVGIIQLAGGYGKSDLRKYWRGANKARGKSYPEPEIVHVGSNMPIGDAVTNMEVTMDLQIVASVCPRAKIVIYFGESDDYSLHDYFHVLAKAIFDRENRPSVLSNSWGWPMLQGIGPSANEVAAFEDLFRKAALLGITICSSAGDHGSMYPVVMLDKPRQGVLRGTYVPITQYPASSGAVLACGGTSIQADPKRTKVLHEYAWNRMAQNFLMQGQAVGIGMATGGGVALEIPRPAYQEDVDVPEVVTRTWNNGVLGKREKRAGRGVPDVAANADFDTGYRWVFNDKWVIGGGTSASAPLWAGLVVLVNQALKERVGFLNPVLYALQTEQPESVLRQVTHGSNGGYHAYSKQLWNGCTGLGVPRGKALVRALKKTLSARRSEAKKRAK